ncbi:hypothetical protein CRG98_002029 [Punica granatum]|uniref:Uncharacterized protein n=1 Tax=Punica granatum TaxID=22663 RepID=A0A2I0LA66_PUNGR|nr:hypothetical protein CRG98_002029 [Punica granatum]
MDIAAYGGSCSGSSEFHMTGGYILIALAALSVDFQICKLATNSFRMFSGPLREGKTGNHESQEMFPTMDVLIFVENKIFTEKTMRWFGQNHENKTLKLFSIGCGPMWSIRRCNWAEVRTDARSRSRRDEVLGGRENFRGRLSPPAPFSSFLLVIELNIFRGEKGNLDGPNGPDDPLFEAQSSSTSPATQACNSSPAHPSSTLKFSQVTVSSIPRGPHLSQAKPNSLVWLASISLSRL